MPQSVTLKARGLYTFPNTLSENPEGSLTTADNCVIDRNSVIEPRRGFAKYGNTFGVSADRCSQLISYKERLLRHFNSTLQYDNGTGTFTSFNGSYAEAETGIKIKSLEANGNLYFTSSTGVKRISASSASQFVSTAGFIRNAGGIKALDVTGTVNYSTAGFFGSTVGGNGAKVAYRVVWGVKDNNTNLILGAPSSRLVVTNFSDTDSGTVDLQFAIPSEIGTTDTQYFYQIYRTAVVEAAFADLDDLDPGDEMNLVIEDFPTSSELTSTRVVSVNDLTPEDFRAGGTLLYTNPVSGEGILQANDVPPLAVDIASFRNVVFYANTKTRQRLDLALLSVSSLTSGTSTISITDGTTTNTYKFRGVKEITEFTFDTQANTTDGGYFLINSASNLRKYFVWMDKTGTTTEPSAADTIGRLAVRVDISAAVTADDVADEVQAAIDDLDDFVATVNTATVTVTNANNGNTTNAANGTTAVGGVFAINVTQQGDGEDSALKEVLLSAAATPSQQIDETARSLVNIINKQSGEIVNAFYLSGPDDVPGLILLEGRTLAQAEFWVTANSTGTGGQFNPEIPTSGMTVNSDNEIEPNAIYFSKFQEPEAVPLVNKFQVGPKDKAILRILALRDSLFILKEDAIYRLTGQPGEFVIDPFDNSTVLVAPDSAVVLNNQIYMLSSQGVATISDTGVSIISRPIEDKLTRIVSSNYSYYANTFGVSYESDRAYLLWTVTNTNDTDPTQCFRYNSFTNSWTRFPISKTSGIVHTADNKLYLGAGDENFIEQERKNFNRKDYSDREISLTIIPDGVFPDNTITLSNNDDVEPGDVIVQTQYLTIPQFNNLLRKLDFDFLVGDDDYYDTLAVSAGDNLRDAVDDLAAKLDADSGVTDTDYLSSLDGAADFITVQEDFNVIIDKLNLDTGVQYVNYRLSEGSVEVEVLVTEQVKNSNDVIVKFNMPFIEGAITVFKGIPVTVVWSPQHMGDPSTHKHISESTFLFEDTIFFTATVSFSSDLSMNFDEITFDRSGIGDWGAFIWGNQNWGGEGSAVPLRTYIPKNKQRCRFIKPKFEHSAAREKFALYGVSLTFKPIGPRAYRE